MPRKFKKYDGIGEERFSRADKGLCPLCGREYACATELTQRIEDGVREPTPGVAYDHDRAGLCIEWSDGKTEVNN